MFYFVRPCASSSCPSFRILRPCTESSVEPLLSSRVDQHFAIKGCLGKSENVWPAGRTLKSRLAYWDKLDSHRVRQSASECVVLAMIFASRQATRDSHKWQATTYVGLDVIEQRCGVLRNARRRAGLPSPSVVPAPTRFENTYCFIIGWSWSSLSLPASSR